MSIRLACLVFNLILFVTCNYYCTDYYQTTSLGVLESSYYCESTPGVIELNPRALLHDYLLYADEYCGNWPNKCNTVGSGCGNWKGMVGSYCCDSAQILQRNPTTKTGPKAIRCNPIFRQEVVTSLGNGNFRSYLQYGLL